MQLSKDEKSKILAQAIANNEITQAQAMTAVKSGTVDALLASLKTADLGDAVVALLREQTSNPHAALGLEVDANLKMRAAGATPKTPPSAGDLGDKVVALMREPQNGVVILPVK